MTFTAAGSTAYKRVGGTVTGDVSVALDLSINDFIGTLILPGDTRFSFERSFGPGQLYSVTAAPQRFSQTCTIVQGKGIIRTADVTNVGVQCTKNSTSPLSGTYTVTDAPGLRTYVTFWPDGTFTSVDLENDPSCGPSNGNGIEYGVYNWNSGTGAFQILRTAIDTNGPCGASNPIGNPLLNLVKSGSTLTVTSPNGGKRVLTAVPSNPSTIVGSFGSYSSDGGFAVFQSDGTYMIAETQLGTGSGELPGYERGCYTVSGSAIIPSLSASCHPDGGFAFDSNGNAGFSDALGTPVPFVITGPNTITAGGRTFVRILPN